MQIDNIIFNAELSDILLELKSQLNANGIDYFSKGFKQSGDSIQMQCPYHGDGHEKKPSAGIRKSDGKFHCFACQQIADLPDVISWCFGKNDMLGKFGWSWLIKNFATVQIEERKDVVLDYYRNSGNIPCDFISDNVGNKSRYRQSDKRVRKDKEVGREYVTEKELDKYRYIHPYMYQRGLTDEIIELFDIGYDRETDSITFPVKDINANCLFVARRSVKTKFYNYPQGVEKPLYGLYELSTLKQIPKELVVCEGMFDALTCWVNGEYAVALNGLGNQLQFKQLRQLHVREYILALDNDEAGVSAKKRLRQQLQDRLITEYQIPNGKKDLNELTKDEFMSMKKFF